MRIDRLSHIHADGPHKFTCRATPTLNARNDKFLSFSDPVRDPQNFKF